MSEDAKRGSENFRIPEHVKSIKQFQLLERLVSFSSMCTGITTESHDVSNGVAAQTVRTVDTACGLTSSIKDLG